MKEMEGTKELLVKDTKRVPHSRFVEMFADHIDKG